MLKFLNETMLIKNIYVLRVYVQFIIWPQFDSQFITTSNF